MIRFVPGRCLLLQLYEKTRINQRRLSELTGIPESQLSDYAHNRKKMGFGTAYSIAKAMKLRCADDLYEWVQVE
jgi:plasmid maintenance system antidote protein VapI